MKDEKLKIDMDGYVLEFTVEPFGYDEEKNNFYCTLKLGLEVDSVKMIELLKLYKNVANIQKQHYSKDENGDPVYLTDVYNLKLEFLRFEEDE